jgi:hypothetical protein
MPRSFFLLMIVLSMVALVAGMKCTQCVESNQTSRVTPGGCSMTAKNCPRYYDEEGNYVSHRCNTCSCHYACSNGHHWETKNKC